MKRNKGRKRPAIARLQATDEERQKCRFCGHDGGKEQVVKQDPVCGIGGYACIDLQACSDRIQKRAANRPLAKLIEVPDSAFWY